MREAALNSRINAMVRREFPEAYIVKISDRSMCGIPDDIGCYKGLFFAMEVKVPGAPAPTKIQAYTMDLIRRAGGVVSVVRSVSEARDFMSYVAYGGLRKNMEERT